LYFKLKGFTYIIDVGYYKEIIGKCKYFLVFDIILNIIWSIITFVMFIFFILHKIYNMEHIFLIIELLLISVVSICGSLYAFKTYSKLNANLESVDQVGEIYNVII
jgi:hypothetical protein